MKNRDFIERVYILVLFLFVNLWFEFLIKIGFVLGGMTGIQAFYSVAGLFVIIQPFFIFAWITFFLYSMYVEKEKIIEFILNR